MISMNLPDPAEQERIRRGPHRYQAEGGVHGRYVRDPYMHQEYPKMMDKSPKPELKDFKGQVNPEILLEHAQTAWDARKTASIVNNPAEEKIWLQEHENDPILTPGVYPKTMDRTPPPRASECTGVEDYREKRQAWHDQVALSIVHDETEEKLWLEEHRPAGIPSKSEKPAGAKRKPAPSKAAPKRRSRKVAVAAA